MQWLFANQALATVVSGSTGSTTPPSGTTEIWPFVSLASWPALSAGQQFAFADTNKGNKSEIMWATAISGSSVTVQRGMEGTATVSHASGATYEIVASTAALNAFIQSPLVNLGDMIAQGPNGLPVVVMGSDSSRAKRLTQSGSGLVSAVPTWQEPSKFVYNIIDYGADWTNQADSYAAINNAIAAMKANGGGVVYSPFGFYGLSQAPGIDNSYATIQGDGYGFYSQWICNFTAASAAMVFASVNAVRDYINFERMCFQGNKNGFGGAGVQYISHAGYIKNCLFQFNAGNAINQQAPATGPLAGATTVDNILEDIYLQFCGGHALFNNMSGDNTVARIRVDGSALRTAPAYSSSLTYQVGSQVSFSGFLYVCSVAGTNNVAPSGTATSNSNWNYAASLNAGSTLWAAGSYAIGALVFNGASGYMYINTVANNTATPPTGQTSANGWIYFSGLDGFNVPAATWQASQCHPYTCVNYGYQLLGNSPQVEGGESESCGLGNMYLNGTKRAVIAKVIMYDLPNPVVMPRHILIGGGALYTSISQVEMHRSGNGYSPVVGVEIGTGGMTGLSLTGCLADDPGMVDFFRCDAGVAASNAEIIGNVLNIAPSLVRGMSLNALTHSTIAHNSMPGASIIENAGDWNLVEDNDVTGGTISLAGANSEARLNRGYNPVGHVTSPAYGSTTNTQHGPARVFITGATTAATLGGVSTGVVNGMVWVEPRETIVPGTGGAWTWYVV